VGSQDLNFSVLPRVFWQFDFTRDSSKTVFAESSLQVLDKSFLLNLANWKRRNSRHGRSHGHHRPRSLYSPFTPCSADPIGSTLEQGEELNLSFKFLNSFHTQTLQTFHRQCPTPHSLCYLVLGQDEVPMSKWTFPGWVMLNKAPVWWLLLMPQCLGVCKEVWGKSLSLPQWGQWFYQVRDPGGANKLLCG
jgi:hypothetical protein